MRGSGLGSVELEADRLAVYILKEGGYPPTAMRNAIVRTLLGVFWKEVDEVLGERGALP